MSGEVRGQGLAGRGRECDTLQALLTTARSGTGQVLVLRGEAGVGKTALLQHVLAGADGFRTARVSGIESDMELAFAGLHQLCAPLLEHLAELPAPQRAALEVAFGLGAGPTPDRFLVGLAVLSLMAAATDRQPLLCVVDDAQWLDEVSVQTLGFVARRLLAEPVALVFAVRDGYPVLAGLPELVLGGLSDSSARELLETVVIGRLDERVRDRIVAETRGIPLALLEAPHSLSAAEGTAGQLEKRFIDRIRALPAETRQLLLVAAAEPVGDAALFLRAAAHLGVAVDALAPAEDAGVIEFGPRMRFHHPLLRSAAYRAAEMAERRAVHRALAAATDAHTDPDRRAWHAANATAGPDDAVAADLEASASRAQIRGGIAAAATFLERAAVLTADPARRGARALAAARAKRDAAALDSAHELLAIAELCPLTDLHRAQVALLRAQMEFAHGRAGGDGAPSLTDAADRLCAAARGLDGLDDELARETYLEALAAAMYAARCGDPGAVAGTARAARLAIDRVPTLHRPVDLLLRAMADVITGTADGRTELRGAVTLWCDHVQRNESRDIGILSLGFPIVQESAAGELWDDEIIVRSAAGMVAYARHTGALTVLPAALAHRAGGHVLAGEFDSAAALLDEADAISAATDYAPMKYHRLHLAVWQGAADAAALIDTAAAAGAHKGEGRLLGVSWYCAAILYNGLSRYREAFEMACRATEFYDQGFGGWCLLELVEAAGHVGDRDAAEQATRGLRDRAGASGTDWGLGALARAQALLADDADADRLFTEAIARFERTGVAVQLARSHLSYGEWLRRANRRADARRQLGDAHEMFTRMGARAFAERARRELSAAGEKVRRQPLATGDRLTAQEAQIARLAADGLTNQEIGAQLFISTHTVEWHLRKVFVKLGVTSRRQLRTTDWDG